jgi:hypothetical protein
MSVIVRHPPAPVFRVFRTEMLAAFKAWITDAKPTPEEVDEEIAATMAAMRQLAGTEQ